MFRRFISAFICIAFIASHYQPVYAQDFTINQLPVPGTMVMESAPFTPLTIKGLVVNPQKPLEFKFIMSSPNALGGDPQEMNQLVKYFLAGLTIPEGDLWVNLSPYEKNRIVPQALGQTDLGRDLLAQDYILKQLTASLIYPEKDLGKEFWSRVYAKAQEQFGTTNIPVNTFNKVWILPNEAQVFENGNAAYVTKSTLKVMLDEDYLAKQKHQTIQNSSISSQIIRTIILPEIEKEVNTGKNFAPLRQIYQALILAKWYKETIQNGLLDTLYTNKKKTDGVNVNDPGIREKIYQRYIQAYKKGAFNYIKDSTSPDGQILPRKYFSGGTLLEIPDLKRNGLRSAIDNNSAMVVVVDLQRKEERNPENIPSVKALLHLLRENGFNASGIVTRAEVVVTIDKKIRFYRLGLLKQVDDLLTRAIVESNGKRAYIKLDGAMFSFDAKLHKLVPLALAATLLMGTPGQAVAQTPISTQQHDKNYTKAYNLANSTALSMDNYNEVEFGLDKYFALSEMGGRAFDAMAATVNAWNGLPGESDNRAKWSIGLIGQLIIKDDRVLPFLNEWKKRNHYSQWQEIQAFYGVEYAFQNLTMDDYLRLIHRPHENLNDFLYHILYSAHANESITQRTFFKEKPSIPQIMDLLHSSDNLERLLGYIALLESGHVTLDPGTYDEITGILKNDQYTALHNQVLLNEMTKFLHPNQAMTTAITQWLHDNQLLTLSAMIGGSVLLVWGTERARAAIDNITWNLNVMRLQTSHDADVRLKAAKYLRQYQYLHKESYDQLGLEEFSKRWNVMERYVSLLIKNKHPSVDEYALKPQYIELVITQIKRGLDFNVVYVPTHDEEDDLAPVEGHFEVVAENTRASYYPAYKELYKNAIYALPNQAMITDLTNGGIDLNQISIKRSGKIINVNFDRAELTALEEGGFKGFTPVIINITSVPSPFPLLGLTESETSL